MTLNNKLNRLLLTAGFSESEVIVYLELLKNPAGNVRDLVNRTKLSKNAVYRAFGKLKQIGIAEKNGQSVKALSLKNLITDLNAKDRKLKKTILDLKQVAPFLRAGNEPAESFETLVTVDQIQEAYEFMAEIDYEVNLDFGDFENFIPIIGGIAIGNTFREKRSKHASHYAICTTFGPNTQHFCTQKAMRQFRNKVDRLDMDYKNQFTIFSDKNDYVMFNHFEDKENPRSVLIKSRAVAEMQRAQFRSLAKRFSE